MQPWAGYMVRADAWMLLGAVLQCALVLRARRFEAHDWILPLFLLIGGSAFWFGFIVLASNVPESAKMFFIGFGFALTASGVYISGTAPQRLKPAALLSLTMTFWAVYLSGALPRTWLIPGVLMSLASLWFAAYPQGTPLGARFALQAWALSAACAAAVAGIPTHASSVIQDYRIEELAHTLTAAEMLVLGAQGFLFFLLGTGIILLADPETWDAWYPSRRDRGLSLGGTAALAVQGGALLWAGRRGGEIQSQLLALSVLGALAHGAMSGGDDEDDEPPLNVDNSDFDTHLDPRDKELLRRVLRAALDYLFRRWLYLLTIAVAAAGAFLLIRRNF